MYYLIKTMICPKAPSTSLTGFAFYDRQLNCLISLPRPFGSFWKWNKTSPILSDQYGSPVQYLSPQTSPIYTHASDNSQT